MIIQSSTVQRNDLASLAKHVWTDQKSKVDDN